MLDVIPMALSTLTRAQEVPMAPYGRSSQWFDLGLAGLGRMSNAHFSVLRGLYVNATLMAPTEMVDDLSYNMTE